MKTETKEIALFNPATLLTIGYAIQIWDVSKDVAQLVSETRHYEKNFHIMYNVGKAKYVVSYHNGTSMHNDGSPFYDIAIFRNKRKMKEFTETLVKEGYIN